MDYPYLHFKNIWTPSNWRYMYPPLWKPSRINNFASSDVTQPSYGLFVRSSRGESLRRCVGVHWGQTCPSRPVLFIVSLTRLDESGCNLIFMSILEEVLFCFCQFNLNILCDRKLCRELHRRPNTEFSTFNKLHLKYPGYFAQSGMCQPIVWRQTSHNIDIQGGWLTTSIRLR